VQNKRTFNNISSPKFQTSSSLNIKITLQKIEGNKAENITLTPGNINIIKKKHSIKINLITWENKANTHRFENYI